LHAHGEDAPDAIHKSIRAAIAVFVCLGAVQISVAVAFHKVALGVDGAHNLVDVLVLFINLRSRHWMRLKRYSALTCKIEPLAPTFSSGLVALSAIGFTALEAATGGGAEGHTGLAIALLALSLVANTFFAQRLHGAEGHDRHSRNALVHLAADATAALIALATYVAIAAGANNVLDVWAAWAATLVIVVSHRKQMIGGIREFNRHKQPEHEHHTEPGHAH
jgi:Co/Zn/Cd efflux system component